MKNWAALGKESRANPRTTSSLWPAESSFLPPFEIVTTVWSNLACGGPAMNFFKAELFLISFSEFGRKSLLNMGLQDTPIFYVSRNIYRAFFSGGPLPWHQIWKISAKTHHFCISTETKVTKQSHFSRISCRCGNWWTAILKDRWDPGNDNSLNRSAMRPF